MICKSPSWLIFSTYGRRLKRYLKFSFSTPCWSQEDDQCLRKDKSTYMVSIFSLNLFLLWPLILLLLSPTQDTLKLVTSLAWFFLHFSKPYGLYYHLHHRIHLIWYFISSLNLHSPLSLYKPHYCFLLYYRKIHYEEYQDIGRKFKK